MFFSRVLVRLGEHKISTAPDCNDKGCLDPVQDIDVQTVIRHKQYNRGQQTNDVALLRLAYAPDTTKSNVKTICLPTASQNQIQQIKAEDRESMTISGMIN